LQSYIAGSNQNFMYVSALRRKELGVQIYQVQFYVLYMCR